MTPVSASLIPDPQVLEGLDKNFGDNDYGIATERQCMERAPSDNQERCDFVQLGLKKVRIIIITINNGPVYHDYSHHHYYPRCTCASARVTSVTGAAGGGGRGCSCCWPSRGSWSGEAGLLISQCEDHQIISSGLVIACQVRSEAWEHAMYAPLLTRPGHSQHKTIE